LNPVSTTPEKRVAVLIDCDNTNPAIIEYSLRVAAQYGRITLRRGYGNHNTLSNKWQTALVEQAFTPQLQFQYASGKNTADIALALDALEAMFDSRADTFCVVTSDSDFAYLCRKLRERGAKVCSVGEEKAPTALRNASDAFFKWTPEEAQPKESSVAASIAEKVHAAGVPLSAKPGVKLRPRFVVEAVQMLSSETPEGKVSLGHLGQYLKRTDPGFSPTSYGHSGLLDMVKTYDLLNPQKEAGGHYTVTLAEKAALATG
jgi:uncharacterized protein (TIGR00288 family)